MPENLKTPGVYIVEKDSGANAIVQVATAVPVFIGFTEKAEVNGVSFHMKPVIVSSLSEFEIFFGGAPKPVFTVKEADEKHDVDLFNQGQEQKCNEFLNLIEGEQHWNYEGKYFDETDKQIEDMKQSLLGKE